MSSGVNMLHLACLSVEMSRSRLHMVVCRLGFTMDPEIKIFKSQK